MQKINCNFSVVIMYPANELNVAASDACLFKCIEVLLQSKAVITLHSNQYVSFLPRNINFTKNPY